MPQKFLSIRDFDKTQHFKKANPPWIKLHKSIFGDREFMKLPISSRYLYFGLLTLASEGCNRVSNDPSWIAQRLAMSPSDIDLRPLYKSGLLIASESSVRRYSEETESETESETEKSREDCAVAPTLQVVPTVKDVKRSLPPDFTFDDRSKHLAESYGLNPYKEFAAFKDRNLATGTTYIDWQAAFRSWLRHAEKFNRKQAAGG